MNFQLLTEAAAALAKIDRAGLLHDLRDELGAVRYRQRQEGQAIGATPWHGLLSSELARLTGADRDECRAAVNASLSPDWPTTAIRTILAYADGLGAEWK